MLRTHSSATPAWLIWSPSVSRGGVARGRMCGDVRIPTKASLGTPSLTSPPPPAMPHELLGECVGVAVVVGPDSCITLRELRTFGLKCGKLRGAGLGMGGTSTALHIASPHHHLPGEHLPELLVLMRTIPKGPTGKPARIGLAKRLALGCVAADGSSPTVWEEERPGSSGDDTDNTSISAR